MMGKILSRLSNILAHKNTRKVIFLIFILQTVFLVFSMPFGVPPDETNNIKFIQYYSEHSLSPIFSDQEPTWYLGDKTREVDYLYHYTMSFVDRILPNQIALYVVRLLSVVTSLAAFVLFAKLWEMIGVSRQVSNFALLLLTNIPMVLMLASAINNDSAVWLALAAALFISAKLLRDVNAVSLLILSNIVIYGGLVKRTFLPLALIFGIFVVYFSIKKSASIIESLKVTNAKSFVLGLILILGIGLFAERLGFNYLQYSTLTPSCIEVQGEEKCSVFWAVNREAYLNTLPKKEPLHPVTFTTAWIGYSFANIFDIQTQEWRHEVAPPPWLTPLAVLLFFLGLAMGIKYELLEKNTIERKIRVSVLILSVYVLFYQLIVNYSKYMSYEVFGVALNGRYILPGFLASIGLVCFYYSKTLPVNITRILAITCLAITVFATGIIMMVRNPQLFGM